MVKDPAFEKCPAEKCPVDKTPEFKSCYHCEDCVVLRALMLEIEQQKPSLAKTLLNKIKGMLWRKNLD